MAEHPKPTLNKRIIVALDVDGLDDAKVIAEELKDTGVIFKIGNQLGTYEGWGKAVKFTNESNARLFADTKFKDIPATVGKSSRAITRHQPYMFNIMADTSLETLQTAVSYTKEAVDEFGLSRPIILGVTVLTSIDNDESLAIYGSSVREKVLQFAKNAAKAGLDGVVCSSQEISLLRENEATKNLLLVTPGIRPKWAATNDQQRIMTPSQAIQKGADYIVTGRPITQPPPEVGSPRKALELIIKELEGVE